MVLSEWGRTECRGSSNDINIYNVIKEREPFVQKLSNNIIYNMKKSQVHTATQPEYGNYYIDSDTVFFSISLFICVEVNNIPLLVGTNMV